MSSLSLDRDISEGKRTEGVYIYNKFHRFLEQYNSLTLSLNVFQQLLLKFHLCTNDSDIEARFAELASDFYKAAEDKMKVIKKALYSVVIPIYRQQLRSV